MQRLSPELSFGIQAEKDNALFVCLCLDTRNLVLKAFPDYQFVSFIPFLLEGLRQQRAQPNGYHALTSPHLDNIKYQHLHFLMPCAYMREDLSPAAEIPGRTAMPSHPLIILGEQAGHWDVPSSLFFIF